MNMLPVSMRILLSVVFFASSLMAQTSNKEFLKKPHVLPSSEKAFHAVYHELDTENSNTPIFGQLYVKLIEDQFTFGGDESKWDAGAFPEQNRNNKKFMGSNIINAADGTYFLVHQDMVKLQKTVFQKNGNQDPDLNTVCLNDDSGFSKDDDPAHHLVYRYGHRVLMTFRATLSDIKCYGTYDTRTDTFTCLKYNPNARKLEPFELQNFLWSQDDGSFWLGSGNVEVFCKVMHSKD